MALIPITNVSKSEWEALYKKFGNGKTKSLGSYESLDSKDHPGHDIARGKRKEPGSDQIVPTGTGYLRTGASNVKGSVQF